MQKVLSKAPSQSKSVREELEWIFLWMFSLRDGFRDTIRTKSDVYDWPFLRSSRPEVFCKKVLLQISQNSQENICARVSLLIELQAQACNFIKNEALAQMFPVNFVQFLRTPFYIEHFWCLLLFSAKIINGLAVKYFCKKAPSQ